ncbi:MAG: wobble nucleotide-excising tRNase [Candidatus Binatia bacterium]|jgi:wobble nucleotide-excising tRNase
MPLTANDRFRTLDSVTGFGLFRNFTWDSGQLGDFKRFNLIYGWNYSGKTTLSRAFQCIESGALHGDFTGGTFRFTKGDGTSVSSTFAEPLPFVRVFNRHFVQRNFQDGSDMTGANVIAVLGEANQALKDRRTDLEARFERVVNFRSNLRDEKATVQQQLDGAETAQARVVIGIVGGPYDRRHLATTITGLPDDHWPLPLSDDELDEKKEQFRKANDFSGVALFSPDHSPIIKTGFKIRQALQEVATNAAIAALQGNPDLGGWVQSGLELNAADSPCGFCGETVSQTRWTELQGHFSEAFAALQSQLRRHRSTVEALRFDAPTLTAASLFPDQRARFQAALDDLKTCLDNAKRSADSLLEVLDGKLAALETPIEWHPDLNAAKELRTSVTSFNSILTEHNERVAAADSVKAEARKAICEHFAVEYLRDSKFLVKTAEMEAIDTRVTDYSSACARIGTQISAAEEAIKNASIAARRINENLAVLLPGDNIEVIKLNDTDFQFQRGGHVAKNMSEGERTAVAFAYFLTKLEEGTRPLEDTIVVLDDPISSLDTNHIYSIHSIVERRLSKALQLFVLTHNAAFFGITKDWMGSRRNRKKTSFCFLLRTSDAAGTWESKVTSLPTLLRKFKSDYQYTYYCLKLINDDPTPQLHHLCGVPNMVRRLLEAYLGFVFPEQGGWGAKLPRIIAC